ncbi:hypothetical protein DSLASN_04110 [Desulfoluna limicola]|uniref:DUF4911 domain-containing protein n=1 Tax=Desulfoluna limicola TaxID=2810562 RepID=A0ABN6F120_9BACT|nr:DUF4911 domain-containing protein [Desulfoluna limicola]BCS94779.1 hypothetical protein DSLASN_04110 [Desulfoluna limicola]
MVCIERFFKLRREDIVFVKYTFEALDNLLVMTTVNRDRDMIVLRIAPGCEEEVDRVLESLEDAVLMEEVFDPDLGEHIP